MDSDDLDLRWRLLERRKERLAIAEEEDELRALQKSRRANKAGEKTAHQPLTMADSAGPSVLRRSNPLPGMKTEVLDSKPAPEIIDLDSPSPPAPERTEAVPHLLQTPINSSLKFPRLTDDPDYRTVILDSRTGDYVELRCPECRLDLGGGNSGRPNGRLELFRGVQGFSSHIKVSHTSKYPLNEYLSYEDVVDLCGKKKLSPEEVAAVHAKDTSTYSIPKIPVPKADAGSFVKKKRGRKTISGEGYEPHTDSATHSRVKQLPDDNIFSPESAPEAPPLRTGTMETRNGGVALFNHPTTQLIQSSDGRLFQRVDSEYGRLEDSGNGGEESEDDSAFYQKPQTH